MTAHTSTSTATIVGARTTVTVDLQLTARCPHRHQHTIGVPDTTDVDTLGAAAIAWAQTHADTCNEAA